MKSPYSTTKNRPKLSNIPPVDGAIPRSLPQCCRRSPEFRAQVGVPWRTTAAQTIQWQDCHDTFFPIQLPFFCIFAGTYKLT